MFDFSTLVTASGGFAWMIVFFVVALSIIVAIHEYGHYIVGRWCGIHADVFSIGFGPALYARKDRRGTVWQIAALPFGGYVKFKGDADPASTPDTQATTSFTTDELRSTMHGAPLWARAATAAAGPVFNFVFSTLVFIGVFLYQGKPSEGLVVADLTPLPQAYGIEVGDEIIGLNGVPVTTQRDLYNAATQIYPQSYDVVRDGAKITVQGPPVMAPIIANVSPQSAAFDAGLESGDTILEINGQPMRDFTQIQSVILSATGTQMTFTIWRNGAVFDTLLSAKETAVPKPEGGFENRWIVGITNGPFFTTQQIPVGILEAVPAATKRTLYIVQTSLSGMWHMAIGNISTCNLSGPIGIAEVSGQMASMGVIPFLMLIAGLSTMIGMMNLLPIPMLDGGHLMFHLYEAIAGRAPSDRTVQILMSIGLSFVLCFMVFAITTDVFCP